MGRLRSYRQSDCDFDLSLAFLCVNGSQNGGRVQREAVQVLSKFKRRLVAILGVLIQTLQDNRVQRRRDLGLKAAGSCRF